MFEKHPAGVGLGVAMLILGLYTPTFAASYGIKKTLPSGANTPPVHAVPPHTGPTFVYLYEIGLNIPIFELVVGTNKTFPEGSSTPP